ncbi:hypothetical protein GCM10011352_18360 [Marinobacterium zhoushanense]|uniref:Uncharacterized protein n=1 Tax=Marinobacterium zhoushanense TaxID=1679163 RepID=A0ABQ1KAA6_9GAMM|nr:hypothetical protein GCM10011352_18360 [Marinobacterium zhoushanense]
MLSMHSFQSQSALLLIIAMIVQLLAVTVTNAQTLGPGPAVHAMQHGSADQGSTAVDVLGVVYADSGAQGCLSVKGDPGSTAQYVTADCVQDSGCLLEHCSSAYALTKAVHQPSPISAASLWPGLVPNPREISAPPLGPPPKVV